MKYTLKLENIFSSSRHSSSHFYLFSSSRHSSFSFLHFFLIRHSSSHFYIFSSSRHKSSHFYIFSSSRHSFFSFLHFFPHQGIVLLIFTFCWQCSAAGFASIGSVCCWASWIRIRNLFVRILPSTRKKVKENLDFYRFVTFYDFLFWKMMLMYLQKKISIKT